MHRDLDGHDRLRATGAEPKMGQDCLSLHISQLPRGPPARVLRQHLQRQRQYVLEL